MARQDGIGVVWMRHRVRRKRQLLLGLPTQAIIYIGPMRPSFVHLGSVEATERVLSAPRIAGDASVSRAIAVFGLRASRGTAGCHTWSSAEAILSDATAGRFGRPAFLACLSAASRSSTGRLFGRGLLFGRGEQSSRGSAELRRRG